MAATASFSNFQLGFVLLFFIYGLAFFTMGIALLLESGRSSGLAERRVIRTLAVFGLIHGMHEWMEIILIQGVWLELPAPADYQILRVVLLALSFIPLVVFGILILFPRAAFLRLTSLGAVLLFVYLGVVFLLARADAANFIVRSDVFARYLLAVPGGVLACLALFVRARQLDLEKRMVLGRQFRWAAAGFGVYGLTQLFVPPADLFLALSLNSAWFRQVTGIPIQAVRAGAAVLITINLLRAMQIMEDERERQLREAQRSRLEALEQVQRELEMRESMRKELLRHTVIAQEEERSRIARELHDETAQILTGFSLDLATLSSTIPRRSEANQILIRLQSLCRQMSQGLVRLVNDLRPAQLDNLGLVAGLQHLTEAEKYRLGLDVSLEVYGGRQRIDPLVETVIYRVAQEALSNVSRHGKVNRAHVHLAFETHAVRLQVCDQGIGFDPTQTLIPPQGWGLAGMRERVESVGGELQINSAPGRGTEVLVMIPVRDIPRAPDEEEDHGKTDSVDAG